jgi:uncharacterized DUF497 family protein
MASVHILEYLSKTSAYKFNLSQETRITTGIRVISFRKANQREGAKHGFSLTSN